MKHYPKDSPEAIARVLVMTLFTDAEILDEEIEALDRLKLYELMGIDREGFAAVVEDYCADLLAGDGQAEARVDLLDAGRIEAVLAPIEAPDKRLLTARMLANVVVADGRMHETELALFRAVLEHWGLTLQDLASAGRGG